MFGLCFAPLIGKTQYNDLIRTQVMSLLSEMELFF